MASTRFSAFNEETTDRASTITPGQYLCRLLRSKLAAAFRSGVVIITRKDKDAVSGFCGEPVVGFTETVVGGAERVSGAHFSRGRRFCALKSDECRRHPFSVKPQFQSRLPDLIFVETTYSFRPGVS